MKYIKKLDDLNKYNEFKLTVNYKEPFVGKIGDLPIRYDKKEERVIATFVTTESNEEQQLYYYYHSTSDGQEVYKLGSECFTQIQIDDNSPINISYFDNNEGKYTFENPGTHVVYYTLKYKNIISGNGFMNGSMVSIKIPNCVEFIDKNTFCCRDLETVQFGNKVKYIGSECFEQTKITSISIPDSCIYIDNNCFYDSAIEYVRMSKNINMIGYDIFSRPYNFTDTENNIVYADNILMGGLNNLETYTIREGTKILNLLSFYYDNSLININIPDSVTYIGEMTFNTTNLPINNHIYYMNNCAVLVDDTTLSSYTIKEGTKYLSSVFGNCENAEQIIIPEGVISIGGRCFNGCSSLESLTLPNSLKYIGAYAFSGCNNLTEITYGNNIEILATETIPNNITNLTIPNSVKLIANNLCYSNTIETVHIGTGIEVIASESFCYCENLTEVIIDNPEPPLIGRSTFTNNSNMTLYVPTESVNKYKNAPGFDQIANQIEGYVEE